MKEHPDAQRAALDGFGESGGVTRRHPIAVVFHVGFRAAAVVWYLFASSLFDGFVFAFIVQVLLLALDFWTVKNVTGRLLVGLRWWNEVKDDG